MDQWLKGRLWVMRYLSVACTSVVPRRPRRRLGFLVCIKWRLPALERSTFPPAVILKRLATDFFVLMPFGRRISSFLSKRAGNIGCGDRRGKRFFAFLSVGAHSAGTALRTSQVNELNKVGRVTPCAPIDRGAGRRARSDA